MGGRRKVPCLLKGVLIQFRTILFRALRSNNMKAYKLNVHSLFGTEVFPTKLFGVAELWHFSCFESLIIDKSANHGSMISIAFEGFLMLEGDSGSSGLCLKEHTESSLQFVRGVAFTIHQKVKCST